MAMLDSRLKRIEEMLITVAPKLNKREKPEGGTNKRTLQQTESLSSSEAEYQSDDEDNDGNDNGENEDEEMAYDQDTDSQSSDSDESEPASTKPVKMQKKPKNPKASKKSPSVNLTFGVPPNISTSGSVAGVGHSLSAFRNKKRDIINTTILNTSDMMSVGDTPLFFCTAAGVKWISEQTGEQLLSKRFEASLKSMHTTNFNNFRNSVEGLETPEPIDHQVLLILTREFKESIASFAIFEEHEIERFVFNEINHGGEGNGFAEKMALHSLVALSLIGAQDRSEVLLALPFKVDMNMVKRHIHSAFYYFFRFALLGNSMVGVKAISALLMCLLFVPSLSPPLMISAIAVRLAQEIGLHSDHFSKNLSRLESEKRTRVWWLIYCLEKDISIKFGKPSCINDDSITVPLPVFTPELDFTISDIKFCFPRSLARLFGIWQRVSSLLTSMSSNRMPVKEILTRLIALDKEVNEWKDAVPPEFQPGNIQDWGKVYSHLSHETLWKLQFDISISHSLYYFVMHTIHRQTAYHPSWIYKISSSADKSDSPGSTTKTTPATDSDSEKFPGVRQYLTAKGASSSGPNAEESSHMSILEQHNNVKLVPRRIAAQNPRLLRSFHIIVQCSRNNIMALQIWKGLPATSYSLTFFMLNSFISLLIKCFTQPTGFDTQLDLEMMRTVIEFVDELTFFTEQMLNESKETFLHVLMEVIVKYVAKKSATGNPSEAANNPVPQPKTTDTHAQPASPDAHSTSAFASSGPEHPASHPPPPVYDFHDLASHTDGLFPPHYFTAAQFAQNGHQHDPLSATNWSGERSSGSGGGNGYPDMNFLEDYILDAHISGDPALFESL